LDNPGFKIGLAPGELPTPVRSEFSAAAGLPGLQQGHDLALALAHRARKATALGDLFGASRLLGLAVRAAPHEPWLLSERDLLWQRLARRHEETPYRAPDLAASAR
jgi:hypothetical protein